jgi:zinc/manganese transport system ATP-binding protein
MGPRLTERRTTHRPDEHPPGVRPDAGTAPVLEFRDACVQMGGRWILRDVSFSIRPGEFVAIIGPNGSGKSTLLKVALGLVPLAEGSVTVLGSDARRGREDIGYLPQRRNFDPDVRIRGRDVVRLGLDGGRWGLPLPFLGGAGRRAIEERVDEVIAQVGAEDYAGRPIGELSGGEQQRLLIAQAFAPRPRLLLLDEPLDSLDQTNQQQVATLVHQICLAESVCVLFVTHDINPVLSHLDSVVYVAAGRAAVGSPDEVITTEALTRLYGVPVEVIHAADGRLIVVGAPGPETVSYHHPHAG